MDDAESAGAPTVGRAGGRSGGRADDNEQIRARIFEAIAEHRLPPGMHLTEDALGDIFGIGRTRVRAILARLAADHVIEQIANRGAFVRTPTIGEAREVFRARRLIEGHLVQRVADNPGPSVRAALEAHLDHEQAIRSAGNQSAVITRSADYHHLLAAQAGSPVMARFLRELSVRSALIIAVYQASAPDACEFEEHRALTELVLAGRGDEAARLMQSHLQGIEDRLDLRPRQVNTTDLRSALLAGG